MAFDKLYYFDKTPTYVSGVGYHHYRHEYGEVQTTFNMSFVIDGTKDSCKVIVYNNDSKELDPLTICWLESTNTWWIVKSDQVTRYANEIGAYYQHEISLYGAFEILNARDLTNCGFNANRYTLEEFLDRLENMMDFEFPLTWDFGTYASLDQEITYLKTFQNYTPASAIKELFNGMNLIPKLIFVTSASIGLTFITGATITAYSKSGSNTPSIDISTFDSEEEKRSSDIESYGTRVISNVQNCVSADQIRYPAIGGVFLTSDDATVKTGNDDNAFLRLPQPVYKVNKLHIYAPIYLYNNKNNYTYRTFVGGTSPDIVVDETRKLLASLSVTMTEEQEAQIRAYCELCQLEMLNGGVYNNIDDTRTGNWYSVFSQNELKYVDFALNSIQYAKTSKETWDTITWEQGKDRITNVRIVDGNIVERSTLQILSSSEYNIELRCGYFNVAHTAFAVEYVPMADLKIKVDNNKEQNDSNLYNQNGKLVDSVAVSKLINAHAKEISSNEISRYKVYLNYNDIPQVSQVVDNGEDKYIINNVSIDFYENDDDNYFMSCTFTMTKQTACKSTMISANTNIRDYDCPQQNNVPRIQLYRDYIELGYEEEHNETPYLALEQVLSFGATSKGLTDNHTCVFSATDDADITYYYQIGTSKYNLNKQFIEVANFKDNNIIGYEAGKSYWVFQVSTLLSLKDSSVNTPISYVDSFGELKSLELRFADEEQLYDAYDSENATDIVGKFVSVPPEIWNYIENNNAYDIAISEPNYDKDGLEVPVFEYSCQVGDNNDIIFGADFLKGEDAIEIKYKARIVDNVYVTQENASAYLNGNDTTISYSNGEITLDMPWNVGPTADYQGKTIVVWCDIYRDVSGIKIYKGTYRNDVGVSKNDGSQTLTLPSRGDLSTFICTSIEVYALDNPYNVSVLSVTSTGDQDISYQLSYGTGGEFATNISVTIEYQTKKKTIVAETKTGTQTVSQNGNPTWLSQDISQNNIPYTDGTTTRLVPTNKTTTFSVSGTCSQIKDADGYYYYNGTVDISNISKESISSVTIPSPHLIVSYTNSTIYFRLRSLIIRQNVSSTITMNYVGYENKTFYKHTRTLRTTRTVGTLSISPNNIQSNYGITGLSNTITSTEMGNATQIDIIAWSDTPTNSYTASYNYVGAYSYNFDVRAENQRNITNVSIDGGSGNTVEVYLKSLQDGYYFKGTAYSTDTSTMGITRNITYEYTETTTQEVIESHTVVEDAWSGWNSYTIPVVQGKLYGTPTVRLTNALIDPFITAESFDTSTGELTYVAGDNGDSDRKVGVLIKYTEWYRNYGLDKQEFLFAVNRCKVSGTTSLTLKVNNWKLK